MSDIKTIVIRPAVQSITVGVPGPQGATGGQGIQGIPGPSGPQGPAGAVDSTSLTTVAEAAAEITTPADTATLSTVTAGVLNKISWASIKAFFAPASHTADTVAHVNNTSLNTTISASTEMIVPADTDEIPFASDALKKFSWAALQAWFAARYLALTGGTLTGGLQVGAHINSASYSVPTTGKALDLNVLQGVHDTGNATSIGLNVNIKAAAPAYDSSIIAASQMNADSMDGGTGFQPLYLIASAAKVNHVGTDVLTWAQGFSGQINNNSTGTITTAMATTYRVLNMSTGTITNAYCLSLGNTLAQAIKNAVGTVINGYGLYIGVIQATNKWAIYSQDATALTCFMGNMMIGSSTPTAGAEMLQVTGAASISGSLKLGAGFGCNGKSPQSAVIATADATDLTTALSLVNQLKSTLIANGIMA